MASRRGHGEGAIFQRHDKSCPPPIDNVRPDHKCRGPWVAEVNLGIVNGKRKRKTIYGRTRKEAAIKLQQALAAKDAGTLVLGRASVETWLRYWLEVVCVEEGLKTNTLKGYRSKIDNYLIPYLGGHQLDKLAPEHVRAMYAAMRRDGLSEATLSQTHAILRRALEVARQERKVSRNVTIDVRRPKAPKNPRDGLTLEQSKAVLVAAGDDPRFYLALMLGMRQGECLALRWSDVDLVRAQLSIVRSLSVEPGELVAEPGRKRRKRGPGRMVFDTPKSEDSVASMPLPPMVLSRLKVAYAQHLNAGGDPDALVFAKPDGSPIHPTADAKAWRDLLAAADVPHVPLHAARNSTATLLKALGVDQWQVQDIMRHASVTMTQHYAGEDLSGKRKALEMLDRALETGRADE